VFHKVPTISPLRPIRDLCRKSNEMKTVCFIRHGKSSWDQAGMPDIERPLKARGKKDGPLMGKVLKSLKLLPDRIVSSPAARAFSSAQLIARVLDFEESQIVTEQGIYFEGPERLMEIVREQPDSAKLIFLLGHNPDLTRVANHFANQRIDNVPTTGVACVDFNINRWAEASWDNGTVRFFDYPKRHK